MDARESCVSETYGRDASDAWKPAGSILTRRLSTILHDKLDEFCARMVAAMKGNRELSGLPLSDEQRLDSV
jgi:hypothetical protein